MLHEKWEDYTRKEIEETKKEKCKKCPYGYKMSSSIDAENMCGYFVVTGRRRGVRPEDCEYYKDKGVKRRRFN